MRKLKKPGEELAPVPLRHHESEATHE